jgi:hypothetical protein
VSDHETAESTVSADIAEFTTSGDKIYLFCLICSHTVEPDFNYLNQAINVWNDHVEDMKAQADAT